MRLDHLLSKEQSTHSDKVSGLCSWAHKWSIDLGLFKKSSISTTHSWEWKLSSEWKLTRHVVGSWGDGWKAKPLGLIRRRNQRLTCKRVNERSSRLYWVPPVFWELHSGREHLCGKIIKRTWRMPWHQKPMKDVVGCDKPRGAVKRALIRGFPNGETQLE